MESCIKILSDEVCQLLVLLKFKSVITCTAEALIFVFSLLLSVETEMEKKPINLWSKSIFLSFIERAKFSTSSTMLVSDQVIWFRALQGVPWELMWYNSNRMFHKMYHSPSQVFLMTIGDTVSYKPSATLWQNFSKNILKPWNNPVLTRVENKVLQIGDYDFSFPWV